jgi:hypothetical protein
LGWLRATGRRLPRFPSGQKNCYLDCHPSSKL